MAEIRLNKLIKQFNIGLDTLVDFLNSKGAGIEHANPNMKVSDEYLPELHRRFGKDRELSETSRDVILSDFLDSQSAPDSEIRLIDLASQHNVGIETLADYLHGIGVFIDPDPNARVPRSYLPAILREFGNEAKEVYVPKPEFATDKYWDSEPDPSVLDYRSVWTKPDVCLSRLMKRYQIGLAELVQHLRDLGADITEPAPSTTIKSDYIQKLDGFLEVKDKNKEEMDKQPLNAGIAPEEFDWDAFENDIVPADNHEEVAALYDQTRQKVVENEVVEGVVTAINKREVVVNIGAKSEGVISAPEFRYNPDLKVGDKVEVLVESAADRKGQLVISHKKARQLKSWDMVTKAYDSGEIVKGYIKTRTKGGMIVDIFGIEAFLPGSQIDTKPIRDFDAFVDTTMDFKIIKVNQEFRNVVVSHRVLLEVPKKDTEDREANLAAKRAVINDLKSLIADAKYGSIKDAFPLFREIQTRWREIGPVPSEYFRDINESYQLYVEKFYDLVVIDRETRDLDFRANLEAKTQLCEQAEALARCEDATEAFKELQKLHERWKDIGPVAKEFRDSLWERFRAATAVVNKLYQKHFEGIKEQMTANLEAKTRLCEQAEALAQREDVPEAFKELQTLHARWKDIGPVPHKSNDSIWERFRAATSILNRSYKAYCKEAGIPWKPIKPSTPTATGEDVKKSHITPTEPAPKKSPTPEIDPSTFFSAKAQKLLSTKKED